MASSQDLRELGLRSETKISEIKSDLMKRIVGMLLAQTAWLAALVKLL